MVALEERHPYGRLADLDVLWLEAGEVQSISREALGYQDGAAFFVTRKQNYADVRERIQSKQYSKNK